MKIPTIIGDEIMLHLLKLNPNRRVTGRHFVFYYGNIKCDKGRHTRAKTSPQFRICDN